MTEKVVNPGDYVIRQGENGDNLYVIESGEFDVFKKNAETGQDMKVFHYSNAGAFGELALMYNCPRAATVQATSPGLLWALDRQSFRFLLVDSNRNKRKMYEDFLEQVPLLAHLTQSERSMVADCLVAQTFEDGDYVIRQGDQEEMPKLYLIEEGEARATQVPDGKEEEVEVGRMKKGDYFGERALITQEPRAANVVAVGTLKVAAMDRASFERLLGECRDIMARQIQTYQSAS